MYIYIYIYIFIDINIQIPTIMVGCTAMDGVICSSWILSPKCSQGPTTRWWTAQWHVTPMDGVTWWMHGTPSFQHIFFKEQHEWIYLFTVGLLDFLLDSCHQDLQIEAMAEIHPSAAPENWTRTDKSRMPTCLHS